MSEQARSRTILFNNLTKVQHRDYAPMVADFRSAMQEDPDFIAHACVHLLTGGTNIRDTADCAAIALLTADKSFPEYREAGRCTLLGQDVYYIIPSDLDVPGLEPFRIFRIDNFIRKYDHKSPRLMKSIMQDYIRFLEYNPNRFDGVAIRNRKNLKSVYTHYHLEPDARAQAILFDNNPPADSKLAVLKQIANSTDVREQARLVIENKIPYVVASSVLPKMSPAVGVALIDVMSPAEALNSRSWVERSGLLDIPEVRDIYTKKVAEATKSVATIDHRKSAQGGDAGVQEAINKAKEKAASEQQKITRNVGVLGDISQSMEDVIPLMLKFLVRIAPLCEGELGVSLFNDYARMLEADWHSIADAERAVRGIRCGGWTSMEAGLRCLLDNGYVPQTVVIISDEGENRGSYARALKWMEDHEMDAPHTVCLTIGQHRSTELSNRIAQAGYRVDRFEFSGEDYYVLDQVAAILGGKPAPTLIDRILSVPLPHRGG